MDYVNPKELLQEVVAVAKRKSELGIGNMMIREILAGAFLGFAQGYEHSLVNMFVIPTGMMFGAPVSVGKWMFWSQLPVTLGNIVSGALLTGLALYAVYPVKRSPASEEPRIAMAEGPESRSVLA